MASQFQDPGRGPSALLRVNSTAPGLRSFDGLRMIGGSARMRTVCPAGPFDRLRINSSAPAPFATREALRACSMLGTHQSATLMGALLGAA